MTRPTRRDAVCLLLGSTSLSPLSAAESGKAPKFQRGINIHHLLNWPDVTQKQGRVDYAWPPFNDRRHRISDDELAGFRRAGFDFVRLTADPSILIAVSEDRWRILSDMILGTVNRLLAVGFSVIFDLHPVAVNPAYAPDLLVAKGNGALFEIFGDLVQRIATILSTLPHDRLAFELINEPRIIQTADLGRWQPMMERLHERARAAAPELPLVLTGAQWSSISALLRLDPSPFRGSNVLYTFHYYDPHTFTHQGIASEAARFITDLHWPPRPDEAESVLERAMSHIAADPTLSLDRVGATVALVRKLISDYMATPSSADLIGRRFAEVEAWAARHAIPRERILLGEFGGGWGVAKSEAVKGDRLAWLRSVKSAAEKSGFPWAYWASEKPIEPEVYAALGLRDDRPG